MCINEYYIVRSWVCIYIHTEIHRQWLHGHILRVVALCHPRVFGRYVYNHASVCSQAAIHPNVFACVYFILFFLLLSLSAAFLLYCISSASAFDCEYFFFRSFSFFLPVLVAFSGFLLHFFLPYHRLPVHTTHKRLVFGKTMSCS